MKNVTENATFSSFSFFRSEHQSRLDSIDDFLDDSDDDETRVPMTSFDAIFRRLILSQTFVRGWGNPQHLQELCASRRAKVSKRSECLKLVPADSIQENTVDIIKQETKGDRQYITAKFPSPMAAHFPNLVRRRRSPSPPDVTHSSCFSLSLDRFHQR